MKKILFVFISFLHLSLLSFSQDVKHVSLSFNMKDFKLLENGETSIIVSSDKYNYHFKSDISLPALPYFSYNVLVHKEDVYTSHTASGLKTLVRSNVSMEKNPMVIPTNIDCTQQTKSETISYERSIYPSHIVEFAGFNDYGDYRLLCFHVCPFEYDATTQKLYLHEQINIDINLRKYSPLSLGVNRSGNRETIKNIIKKIIVNPNDLDEEETVINRNQSNQDLVLQTGYEYVIVTSNQFKNTFQELANWKSRKGIRAKVISVEDIDTTYNGASKQEKIKRALADIDGLSYVLLGGDTLNVPTCMCFIGHHENADSITPADSYYSCLGTMDWDRYTNGLYGELEDSISMLPSLNVSRAPVSTVADAQVFVNRIINYESMPDTLNWTTNILMSGTSLGYHDENNSWHPYYENGQSDTQIWSQMMYDTYIAQTDTNIWNGSLTRFYDTYTDISGDDSYEFSYSNLQTELAKGYTFVDVMTHGGKTCFQMEGSYPLYTYYSAGLLNNSGNSIITTTACLTNAFDYHSDYSNSLSQSFINNPQSGILAYWGTSRENWYYAKNTSFLGTGEEFDGLTYRKLFEDKYHRMGNATTAVKIEKMSSAQGFYGSDRKIWMSLNLMGDPEMPVFLSKPKTFQNVDIRFVNDNIYVNAGTGGFDICFINKSNPDDYYIARNIVNSEVVFPRLNGVYDVCITKPGYIPYTAVCGDTIYLQNMTLTGVKNFKTYNTIIGSNVTNKITQGPVVVSTGSTTIKASQGTTITKDFQVDLGAEFAITNE